MARDPFKGLFTSGKTGPLGPLPAVAFKTGWTSKSPTVPLCPPFPLIWAAMLWHQVHRLKQLLWMNSIYRWHPRWRMHRNLASVDLSTWTTSHPSAPSSERSEWLAFSLPFLTPAGSNPRLAQTMAQACRNYGISRHAISSPSWSWPKHVCTLNTWH